MEQVFTTIYETSAWGDNNALEYKGSSGSGSDVEYNKTEYIPFLKQFIRDFNIKSIVDLGCGDFRCGRLLYHDVSYVGYDTYKDVVEYNARCHPTYSFHHMDFYSKKETIKSADLCILKDVLQHWSLEHIYTLLDYLVESNKFKYILICNCSAQSQDNTDILDGDWRPLSCAYLPLKKYNPTRMLTYHTKEVCLIG